jgi:hypothetical protein
MQQEAMTNELSFFLFNNIFIKKNKKKLSSTRPNYIDDVFGTIANGKLCLLVLVNISLQVFLNYSQHISDDFGLFLQIASDGATTAFSKQYYWRTDFVYLAVLGHCPLLGM